MLIIIAGIINMGDIVSRLRKKETPVEPLEHTPVRPYSEPSEVSIFVLFECVLYFKINSQLVSAVPC